MKTITAITRRGSRWLARVGGWLGPLLAGGLLLAGCGSTGPDESPWQHVSDFSWPTTTGTLLRYRVEKKYPDTTYTSTVTTEGSDFKYHGTTMYRLDDDGSIKLRLLYLPLADTLVVHNEEFGGSYLLVGPLDKGHSWISGYSDEQETKPSWQATIIDRYSHLQLEGKMFDNVIVVKYVPLDKSEQGRYWIRFYAQNQGPIQTIQHFAMPPDSVLSGSTIPSEAITLKRTTLVETTAAAQN